MNGANVGFRMGCYNPALLDISHSIKIVDEGSEGLFVVIVERNSDSTVVDECSVAKVVSEGLDLIDLIVSAVNLTKSDGVVD
jgi:hypothetical protein